MTVLSAKTYGTFLLLFTFHVVVCSTKNSSTQEEMAEENLKKLATANNELALNLYEKLSANSSQNIFFSPLSLSTAFGMLFYGSRGETAKELRTALGYNTANLPSELVHTSFNHFLTEALPPNNSEYTLNLANAILLDEKLDLIPTYKSEIQRLYHASVQGVNFARDEANLIHEINTWVKEKTNGKIDSILRSLNPSTVMVILNAVYFKGIWKQQFKPEKTKPQLFYNGGEESTAKTVPMMHTEAKLHYTSVQNLQALELPYTGDNISMIVLLPQSRDGLSSLEKSLTLEKLSNIRKQLHQRKVIVSLPKFKIQYSREMSSDIRALGAKNIFTPGSADFSGMTPSSNVYVNQVLHKAVVEVNEEGSVAAAVTGIVMNRMSYTVGSTPEFIADHPFVFAIVDRRTGMVLFVGRVTSL